MSKLKPNIIRTRWTDICDFTPRQNDAYGALQQGIRFLLYGGALGGGKSFFLRWCLLRRLLELYGRYKLRNVAVMLACEDYPALKDRQLQKIGIEFPAWLGELKDDHKLYSRCFLLKPQFGGGAICFRNLDDPSKYQSAEFAAIGVDELTKNTYDVFTFLRSRLRWPGLPDEQTWLIGGTNPGGVGHGWVKQLWIDKTFPEEWISPVDFRPFFEFVPSKATDNPHLDPSYWTTLQTLPVNLRAAFRDGSWDVFIGQAFPQLQREIHGWKWDGHIPTGAPLYMTYDWGYGKPFSIGWWYVDSDGRGWRFAEWYGWSQVPDTGLRMADTDVVKALKAKEDQLGLTDKPIIRLAGHDCWNKKPDYQGGGQGPSTAEVFSAENIFLIKADPSRAQKLRQFRERIRVPETGELPMMMVALQCEQFWRTMTTLPMDDKNIEDVDTKAEDHVFDEVAQFAMARPLALTIPAEKVPYTTKLIDSLNKPEIEVERAFFGDYEEREDYGDGRLLSTL